MQRNRSICFMLVALISLLVAPRLFAQVDISVSFGPPALPVYEQPPCPEEGYIWTPGYWAYDPDYGYYWVPGTWVLAPEPGLLWTPGWWGWGGNAFLFHTGYWAPHIGFYGGINYGYGYFGDGFQGGRWDGGHFFYNRAVNNVNVTNIHNTYNTTIVNNVNINNRVSYNGGNGGIGARPTPEQQAIDHERHVPPVAEQERHLQTARANPELRASANQGKPSIAATDRPGAFQGHGVVAARAAGAPYHPAPNQGASPTHTNPTHASELQQHQAPTPSSTGNPKMDQKYQQQQAQLAAKQNQQHQQLQARQEQQHQQMQQRQAQAQQQQNQARQQQMAQQNQARQQQMEQQHQQQTQHMEQMHVQQTQHLQDRQMGDRQMGHGGGRPH